MQRLDRTSRGSKRWWYLLLLVPYVALLWVPFYAGAQPEIAGIPYFYWYQFLWVLIAAILTAVVYFATREEDTA
jgi:Na+/melibiose symporter-like transporter